MSNHGHDPDRVDWLDLGPDPDEDRKPVDRRRRYLWYGGSAGLVVVALLLAQTQHRTNQSVTSAGSPSRTPSSSPASSTPASSGPSVDPTPSMTAPSAGFATAGQPAAPQADPKIISLGYPLPNVPHDWELFALGSDVVIRIQLALGRITTTPAPASSSDFSSAFLVGSDRVLVRSPGNAAGYVVRDGKRPTDLPAALQGADVMLPGPDRQHLWMNKHPGDLAELVLVNLEGKPTGVTIKVPPQGYVQGPDGAGYVLLTALGGTYDARPGKVHRITSGALRASGPTRWLTAECDDSLSCAQVVIDSVTGARHSLDTPVDSADQNTGTISPDGKTAALLRPPDSVSGNGIQLLDLDSGAIQLVNVTAPEGIPLVPRWAWSPDSRWIFVTDAGGRVIIINRRTGQATPLRTQLPQVHQLALRHKGS